MKTDNALSWDELATEYDKRHGGLKMRKVSIVFEKHFGFLVSWEYGCSIYYPLWISIMIPFLTISIGIGKIKHRGINHENQDAIR